MAKMPTWPQRSHTELHDELHARPAPPVSTPSVVSYWLNWGMDASHAERALAALCEGVGAPKPAPGVRHHVVHAGTYALKYERHGEFISWQVNRALQPLPESPSNSQLSAVLLESSAVTGLPASFVEHLQGDGSGRMLAATHVVLLGALGEEWLNRCLALLASRSPTRGADDATALVGGWIGVGRRAAQVSDLRVHGDGFTRFVLLDFDLPPAQAARECQRLCEIEAYRMLSMLGFPIAQQEAARLPDLEQQLHRVVDAMANDPHYDDAGAFETLTRLAAEVEHGNARTRYRFSATRAYHRLVERRLSDLREERIHGVQLLSGFLSRRFAPAMALCESTEARLTDVAERINRAVSLARAGLEVKREKSNQQLFQALVHRQKLQLRLQQAVEGLSVVAISYYAIGLVGYVAKGLKDALHIQPDAVVAAAVVPTLAAIAWIAHRLHARWSD
jgi:uncharacterized membrane-anchored protein